MGFMSQLTKNEKKFVHLLYYKQMNSLMFHGLTLLDFMHETSNQAA